MTTSMIAAILFVLSVWTSSVHSSCMRGLLVSQLTGEYSDLSLVSSSVNRIDLVAHGNLDQHCVYNEMKVLPGSVFRIAAPDCLECKCSKQGLVCCGFGFSAGLVQEPDGCIAHNDACRLVFVKKDNVSEPCLSSKSPAHSKKFKTGSSGRRS